MMSPTIGALAAALAKAQGEMKSAEKNRTNPFFNSKYADLDSVFEAIRAPLSKHGLAVTQIIMGGDAGIMILRTYLMHSSGEFVSSDLPIKPAKQDAQGIGAYITYMKRFALSAIIGVSTDDDDDGNAATGKPSENPNVYRAPVNHNQKPAAPAAKPQAIKPSVSTPVAAKPVVQTGTASQPEGEMFDEMPPWVK